MHLGLCTSYHFDHKEWVLLVEFSHCQEEYKLQIFYRDHKLLIEIRIQVIGLLHVYMIPQLGALPYNHNSLGHLPQRWRRVLCSNANLILAAINWKKKSIKKVSLINLPLTFILVAYVNMSLVTIQNTTLVTFVLYLKMTSLVTTITPFSC